MKKLTTVIMVLSLVLGGVALAAASDLPQAVDNLQLSAMQKVSDQEAQQIRGAAMGPGAGTCLNTSCIPKDNSNSYGTGLGLYSKNIYNNYGGNNLK